ncbi:MAG: phospho-sugar mutase, partial [Candidatus Heimdallarchaeota archaeon]|nr:phospho-sugar mutase [Candidatus Heimdallarchaeota archaeon]
GKTLFELLVDIYIEFGFYKDRLFYLVKEGISGANEIQEMMNTYRSNPMQKINNSKVIKIKDYLLQKEKDLTNNIEKPIYLPKSNVLQFYLEDDSKISVRPSGTEPKIKYYIEVKDILKNKSEFENTNELLENKIDNIVCSLGIR